MTLPHSLNDNLPEDVGLRDAPRLGHEPGAAQLRGLARVRLVPPREGEGEDPTAFVGQEDYAPENPRWQAIDRALTEIASRCRAMGVPFVVFTLDDRERKPVAMVREVGAREGFPVINLVPWRDPRWAAKDPRSIANSPLDRHLRPEGSRIYGRMIAEDLWRLGAVPARGSALP